MLPINLRRPRRRLRLSPVTAGLCSVVLAACNSPTSNPTIDPISGEETMPLFLFSHVQTNLGYNGHGFVLKREGLQPIAVTAYHVAGPATQAQTVSLQPVAWLRTIVDGQINVGVGPRKLIQGAKTINADESQKDVAAFGVIDYIPERALELATDAPAVDDTVYVLALHTGDHPRSGPRRHPARVTVSSETQLKYLYLQSANANLTSGAAVLDKNGRVVGLNVGTTVGGSLVYGLAVHAASLRALLPQ